MTPGRAALAVVKWLNPMPPFVRIAKTSFGNPGRALARQAREAVGRLPKIIEAPESKEAVRAAFRESFRRGPFLALAVWELLGAAVWWPFGNGRILGVSLVFISAPVVVFGALALFIFFRTRG